MIATSNLPGSQHFAYFEGTRAECEEWISSRRRHIANRCGSVVPGLPYRITSNDAAAKWRYLDGRRVVKFGDEAFL